LIYKYYLECKKGCEIEYIIETDVKEYITKNKPLCPKCGRRIYENEQKTVISVSKVKTKKLSMDDEIDRRHKHKKATDKRRKKVNNHS